MKYILLVILINSLLFSEEAREKNTLVELKDTSGLSDNAVRAIAEKSDKEARKTISLKEVYEVTDSNGSVNVQKLQATWEEQTPKTNGFDWIKTTKGEWFKGQIKAMYDEKVEFDSEEVGLYTFDLDDISNIKTHNVIDVNIEKVASVTGIMRMDDKKVRIIQGNTEYDFKREQVISFAPDGELERNLWSGKITISIDKRAGNKDQFDYTGQVNLRRRTDSTSLSIDYLGRTSNVDSEGVANDHRLSQTYNKFITRKFFWTPLFSEFYRDKYQNIDSQLTASIGIGYKIVDNRELEWSVSGGPGILSTQYYTVEEGTDDAARSASLEMRTNLEYELFKRSDLIYDYKLTITDSASGSYKHHMIFTLENEITSWLDLDFSFIWDHIKNPTNLEDNTTPFKNDYQLLVGVGLEF